VEKQVRQPLSSRPLDVGGEESPGSTEQDAG